MYLGTWEFILQSNGWLKNTPICRNTTKLKDNNFGHPKHRILWSACMQKYKITRMYKCSSELEIKPIPSWIQYPRIISWTLHTCVKPQRLTRQFSCGQWTGIGQWTVGLTLSNIGINFDNFIHHYHTPLCHIYLSIVENLWDHSSQLGTESNRVPKERLLFNYWFSIHKYW